VPPHRLKYKAVEAVLSGGKQQALKRNAGTVGTLLLLVRNTAMQFNEHH
jgi:hypothetical protein